MSLVTDKPQGLPSEPNDLDDIVDPDLTEIPPAYLGFGASPAALPNPPKVGEVRTYIVRARCTGEHGPIERKDGELRYTRTLSIQACWEKGQPEPPDADEPQPGLFDNDGNPTEEPQTVGEIVGEDFNPPEFSG